MPKITELADILNVPVITTGTFQGHKGPPVVVDNDYYARMLKASNKFQPLLKQARDTGIMPGNPDFFNRLGKPIPAPITLNHQVLEDDKIKESLKNVKVEFAEDVIKSPEFPDGKPWLTEYFSGVDPVVADIIRRFFTQRSVEIMELTDPDTGILEPVVISTAFLSNSKIPPAVPGQTDDLYVEFAALDESHYIIYPDKGEHIMPENKDTTVDVAELQKRDAKIAELQANAAQSEENETKAVELAKQQAAELAELRKSNESLDSDKLVSNLGRIRKHGEQAFQITPAFQAIIEPIIRGNGVIELADGQSYRQALAAKFDEIAELAALQGAGKGGVVFELSMHGEKSFVAPGSEPQTETEQVDALISELQAADPKLSYDAAEKQAFITVQNRMYGGSK